MTRNVGTKRDAAVTGRVVGAIRRQANVQLASSPLFLTEAGSERILLSFSDQFNAFYEDSIKPGPRNPLPGGYKTLIAIVVDHGRLGQERPYFVH